MTKRWISLVVVLMVAAIGLHAAEQPPALAQPAEPIKRTPLQRFDVPGTSFETVIGIAELAPNVNVGRHTHPGPESGYVLEGEFTLLVDGQPAVQLTAGGSYKISAGAVHDARAGARGARVIATYVVEKGKPLASPAN
jgi:quercetin dioxygenase-like cupin family protein